MRHIFYLSLLLTTGFYAAAQEIVMAQQDWSIQVAHLPSLEPDQALWKQVAAMPVSDSTVKSVWYQKDVLIPGSWSNKRLIMDFRRIEGDAILFVNGSQVGEILRPGGEIEITKFVHSGKQNQLRVFVTRNYTGISRGFSQDPLRYYSRKMATTPVPFEKWGLGLSAPVKLLCRNATAVTDVFCIPSYRGQKLTLQVELDATDLSLAVKSPVLEAEILDQQGQTALSFKSEGLKLSKGKATYIFSAAWKAPHYWDLDRPYLYRAEVSLKCKGKLIDKFAEVTFGFREIWTEGNQLYMNGHLCRWRLTDLYGSNLYGLSFYRLMGYNVGQMQPHSSLWWRGNAETPLLPEDMLMEMDRTGMGCTVPAPGITILRGALLKDTALLDAYKKEVDYFIRHYRNHPSILSWVVSMNSSNPKANISPQQMGKRDTMLKEQSKVIDLACQVVKFSDPTRLSFSHADGSIGDISTANVYLNFVPLQEREEWPMEWAKHGNMPYSAVEFGPPYWNNFWKGNQLLLTEYLSIFQGDLAYHKEDEGALASTIKNSLKPELSTWEQIDFAQYPTFWSFQTLFALNTSRSWRSWGVNGGWMQWLLEGYGNPPGTTNPKYNNRYRSLTASLQMKPPWANPRFDIYQACNVPLLAYIGGSPLHTDKTHTFFSGSKIEKQISVVWDGPEQRRLSASWVLKDSSKVWSKGTQTINIEGGAALQRSFSLTAPEVAEKKYFNLVMQVHENGQTVAADTFKLAVFPRFRPAAVGGKVLLFDPQECSGAWLKGLGLQVERWVPGNRFKPTDLLLIGRQALEAGQPLPFSSNDILNGLHVLILEQVPAVWEGMGFESLEAMSRQCFIRDRANSVFNGLDAEDFHNWAGSPDLLPEGRLARSYSVLHAPKWTNRHAVASLSLKIPQVSGFTPLLQTEFDMAYSPLLEYRYGKGVITFCTLDLTGRVGVDPSATRFAQNLIQARSRQTTQHSVYYMGDSLGRATLLNAGVSLLTHFTGSAADVILAIGGGKLPWATQKIEDFARQGGTVLYLSQTATALKSRGFDTEVKTIYKVPQVNEQGLLRAIGPNLLRWRDSIRVSIFKAEHQPAGSVVSLGGLLLEQHPGKGRIIFLQASPDLLSQRYKNDLPKKEAIQLSVVRLQQLLSQVFTNVGMRPAEHIIDRLCGVEGLPESPMPVGFYAPFFKSFDPYQFTYW